MADKRRFALFAAHIKESLPNVRRVFDVAGGMGGLNAALTVLGIETTTFDSRRKRLPVRFAERRFTLEEPCECDLVAGLHPDGATRLIIEYAAKHRIPFAIVPCCSDNGMSYKPWMRHLAELGAQAGFTVSEGKLPIDGRSRVLTGLPLCVI
ncbi:MAG: hypothetical protein HY925_09265 [Elusimicrobia bacterium]|nr:hypothetical protein [Elusimicrobiota bacterium]